MKTKFNVPKDLEKYFGSLEREDGLIDGKYVLSFAPGYAYMGEYPLWIVNSKKEALESLRCAEPERGYDEKLADGMVEPRRDDFDYNDLNEKA